MPSKPRSRINSLALKTLYGALASAVFLSCAASAAGLGKLTVLSSLGQPLRAEIEVTSVSNEEVNGLVAKVAPAEAFKIANIDYSPALLSLRLTVEPRDGRKYIKITSSQPVNEPFVDMLLELSWNGGSERLVREYTFLLDPPELRAPQPAQVAGAPADVPQQGTRANTPAGQSAPAVATAAAGAQRAVSPTGRASRAVPSSDIKQYKVKRGDTLGRIAESFKPGDISLDMMLVALYRANPDAFIDNNMNRLKSGQILSVPDSNAIRASGTGEGAAHGTVVAHAADFNAYRNKLAGQVASAAPSKTQDSGKSASGKIVARVEEKATAANESKDKLTLLKAAAAGAAGKSATSGTEDTIAMERAMADATARLKELERNVNDLEKLNDVKNKSGSEANKSALADKGITEPVAPVPTAAVAVPAPVAVKPAPVRAAAPKKAPEPAERSFADMLMDNLTYLGAALAVLLLALFGLSRRKPKDTGAPVEPSILGAPTGPAHSLFAEAGGQSVDTSNSVFNSSFAPSASQLDTNEVDPVAEADVYIAYGRDAQAEEILKDALRTHPERHAVRHKLLEIYAARKDVRAFEVQAGEMYGLSRGQGDDWAQAAALGLTIDPRNPLYAPVAAPVAASFAEPLAGQAAPGPIQEHSLAAQPEQHRFEAALAGHTAHAVPQPLAAVAAPADADADEHTLDFDLGGPDFEPLSSTEPSVAADPNAMEFTSSGPIVVTALPSDEEQPFDLAFDLAFDSPAAATAPIEPKPLDDMRLDLAGDQHSAEFDMAELAREFDLPHLAEGAPAGTVFADPLAELDAMDFDLPVIPGAAPSQPALGDDDDPFALPDLPDLPDMPGTAPHSAAAAQFDISDIDLDMPFDTAGARGAQSSAPALASALADPVEMSASHMEMETKLDLAIAYQEIGDKEGARELLDEVIKGGSDDQVSKANDMRAKLA